MKKILTNKNVTIINFLIISFFSSLFLITEYISNEAFIEVYIQLLMIPFSIMLLFFSILGVIYFFTSETKTLLRSISSIGIIGISSFIVIAIIALN